MVSPRPYSRINTISGTDGISADYPPRLALETKEKGAHRWMKPEDYAEMRQKWEHPLMKRCGDIAKKVGGHGGMDFIMNWRLIYCLVNGLPLDQDVYDGVLWSAVGPLSQKSVTQRSGSLDVPDFTRGGWAKAKPWAIVDIENDTVGLRGIEATPKAQDPGMKH